MEVAAVGDVTPSPKAWPITTYAGRGGGRNGRVGSAAGGPGPAPRVLGVLGPARGRAEAQRAECVDHYGGLVGGGLALGKPRDRRLHRTRLRAVGEPRGMQRDRAEPDSRALP